ncbi:aldo/keto reductase [Chloroflexota bacterium]
MLKRRLGRTNFEASVVGFGGIPIQHRSREEAVAIVRRALEMGVNYIDTARAYHDSEDKIGAAIKECRDQVFVSTKTMQRSKREAAADIDESLHHLKTEYIDLLFSHGVDTESDLNRFLGSGGAIEAFKEAQIAGEVRYIGISGHRNPVLISAIQTGVFDVIMASYNLTNTDADSELFPLAQKLDIGVLIMKPLAGGSLAVPPEAIRFRAAERAVTTAETALRFVLINPLIHTVVPGMGRLSELEANVPLGNVPQSMGTEEIALLLEKARGLGSTFCQGCNYCVSECPQEINIPEVFRLLAFHEQYGMTGYARAVFQSQHENRVSQCTECQSCMERCPAQLEIPQLLEKAKITLGQN